MMQNRPTLTDRTAMFKELLLDQSIPLDCDMVEVQLGAYHLATLQQQHTDPEWLPIAIHLNHCPACAQHYQWLQEESAWESGLAEISPAQVPTPDLSFLQQGVTSQFAAQVQTAPETFPGFLQRTVSGLLCDIGLALHTLVPQPPPTVEGARQSAQRDARYYELPMIEADGLLVKVTIEEVLDELAQSSVTVQVDFDTEAGDQAAQETEVVLWSTDVMQDASLVDEEGTVQFQVSHRDLPSIKIEIIPSTER